MTSLISIYFHTSPTPHLQVLLPTLVCVAHGSAHICDSLSPHLSLRWLLHGIEQSPPPAVDIAAATSTGDSGTSAHTASTTAGGATDQSPAPSSNHHAAAAAALRRPALLLDRVCALMGAAGAGGNSNGTSGSGVRSPLPLQQRAAASGPPGAAGGEGAGSLLPLLPAYSGLSCRFPVDLLPGAHDFFLQQCQEKSLATV